MQTGGTDTFAGNMIQNHSKNILLCKKVLSKGTVSSMFVALVLKAGERMFLVL